MARPEARRRARMRADDRQRPSRLLRHGRLVHLGALPLAGALPRPHTWLLTKCEAGVRTVPTHVASETGVPLLCVHAYRYALSLVL